MDNSVEESLLEDYDRKGGFRTLPFIIATESLEKMATFALMANMSLYLMKEYHMEIRSASNVLFLWSSATTFMPILGALIADSYLGRFYTIGFGSLVCFMGMSLLWLTAVIPQARPPPCDQSNGVCRPPNTFQLLHLFASFGLISIGAGCVRSSSLAFGANQLQKGEFETRSGLKESYFSWYYATYTLSALFSLTCVVYIQDNVGWGVGFAVSAVLMLLGVISFFIGSPFYVKLKGKSSLLTGFVQVVVASYRNRHLKLSDGASYICHCKNGSPLVLPSRRLRYLNKACIIRDPENDLNLSGEAKDPWSLCTVDQVEELKSLLGVIPLWSTGMIMSINSSQNTFPVLQAESMDRHITPNFSIPSASFSMFVVIAAIIWIIVYDRMFLPLASKYKGSPVRISTKTRMGIGIFLSFLGMMVSSIVEATRRYLAITEGFLNVPQASVHMSALWLIPQNCLTGFAEAANAIAQNEFYFSEFPRSMSSIAASLNGIGASFANLAASSIMSTIDKVTKAGGKDSWISSNINKGHYDYYYLVLAGISTANMIYFLVCSSAYGPLKDERKTGAEEEEEFRVAVTEESSCRLYME